MSTSHHLREGKLSSSAKSTLGIFLLAVFLCAGLGVHTELSSSQDVKVAYAAEKVPGSVRKEFTRALRAGDKATLTTIVNRLSEHPCEMSVKMILDALVQVPDTSLYNAGQKTLISYEIEVIDAAFKKILENLKSHPLRVTCIVAIADEVKEEVGEDWLILALKHKSGLVVTNSIRALAKKKSKKAILPLIDLLDRVGIRSGSVSSAVEDALYELTWTEMETVADWRKFWAGKGQSIDPKKLGKAGDGNTGLRKKERSGREFFGMPIEEIEQANVCFVIDTSGSMQQDQRINRTKNQLKEAIKALGVKAKFNIIAYNSTVKSFKKKLVKASSKSKKKASKFVSGLQANNLTHTDDALEAAFKDMAVNTIILLSDGAPFKGGNQASMNGLISKIEKRVKELNRIRKVKVHTFGFTDGSGQDELADFLKRLAKDNGGKFTPIK